MMHVVEVTPLPDYRLYLRFADDVAGEVDLSDLVGKGVFACWKDQEVFRKVAIGTSGELLWPDNVDMCPDSLYLKITGMTADQLFPSLHSNAHA